MDFLKVPVKVLVGHLIGALELAVPISFLLHSIVGQVDEPAFDVGESELFRARPQVAVLEKVATPYSVDACEKTEASNIKFSFTIEQRIRKVLLQDADFSAGILLEVSLNFFDRVHNSNAISSVGVLPWFHNPYLPLFKSREKWTRGERLLIH